MKDLIHLILVLIAAFVLNACMESQNYSNKEKQLIEIAKKEWSKSFKGDFKGYEPFLIRDDDSLWVVEGSLPADTDGGTPVAVIDKKTFKVVEVYHMK